MPHASNNAQSSRWQRWLLCLFAILFVTGCAINTGSRGQRDVNSSSWHGRLAVRVDADTSPTNAPSQSFSAAFELQGNAQHGTLLLLTPLGSTAASVRWTAMSATLQSGAETREFPDVQALVYHLLGTDIPVPALFAWLDGQPVAHDGWQVDLARRSEGKITARRLTPMPMAELRLILED